MPPDLPNYFEVIPLIALQPNFGLNLLVAERHSRGDVVGAARVQDTQFECPRPLVRQFLIVEVIYIDDQAIDIRRHSPQVVAKAVLSVPHLAERSEERNHDIGGKGRFGQELDVVSVAVLLQPGADDPAQAQRSHKTAGGNHDQDQRGKGQHPAA